MFLELAQGFGLVTPDPSPHISWVGSGTLGTRLKGYSELRGGARLVPRLGVGEGRGRRGRREKGEGGRGGEHL